MYLFMSYQTDPVTECPFYTLHKNTDFNYYVCVDELSECSLDWMRYYTLHKNNGAHQYVWVDVLSGCNIYWMSY
jgi:hypothetical protein